MPAEAVNADLIRIEKPSPPAIVAELAPIVSAARAFQVRDVETNAAALERVRSLRIAEKRIADHFEPTRKALDTAKKELLQARDSLIAPIAAARSIYDEKAALYEREQRRIAEEEQRRLQAQAQKEEEERSLMAAIEAEQAGDTKEADAILAQPVSTPVVTVQPQVAKVEGVSTRTTWSAEVFDMVALVKYVAAHPEWIALVDPAMPNLNRLAVAQHEALFIPGVRAVSKTVRGVR